VTLPSVSGIDYAHEIASVLPAHLPGRLVELAEQATEGPVGLYVVDIEGFRLVSLAGAAGLPAELEIFSGLGPEIGPHGIAEVVEAVERIMPGAVVAPLWVRCRATAVLLAAQDPHGTLRALAEAAAPGFELAAGYTDVVDRARRVRRTSPAAEVQQDLLAPRIAPIAGGEVAGSLLPAYDVGGDWFDHAENPEGAWLAVADAMGKGSRAAAVSALALAALRGARRSGDSLEDCCRCVHDVIADLGGSDSSLFLTAVVATWDATSSTLSWVCCGHPAPVLVTADGEVEELEGHRTFPLGLPLTEHRHFVRNQRPLASGDRVVLYSDGITERRTADGRFGLGGLVAALRGAADDSAAATVIALERAVLAASEDPISDDATQLVLRVT
jgi:serine phosphatase RsbU (regulator of sigma subunit)